jgi:hypothetical protein
MALGIGAAILGGAAISGIGSLLAGDKQSDAAKSAARGTQQQYQQTRSDLLPYTQGGTVALNELMFLLGLGPRTGSAQAPTREQFTSTETVPGARRSGPVMMDRNTNIGGVAPTTRTRFDQAGYDAAMGGYNAQQAASQSDPRYGSLLKPFSLADFQQSPAYQFNLEEGYKAINKGAAARGKYYNPATLQDLGKFSQGTASNEFLNAYNMYNQDQGNVFGRLSSVAGMGQNSAAQTGALGANAANNSGQALMGAGNAQAAGIVGLGNAVNTGIGQYYNNQLMEQILKTRQPTYGSFFP